MQRDPRCVEREREREHRREPKPVLGSPRVEQRRTGDHAFEQQPGDRPRAAIGPLGGEDEESAEAEHRVRSEPRHAGKRTRTRG